MGQVTTLMEIVDSCNGLNAVDTIYAQEPWTEQSVAVVATEPSSGDLPEDAKRLGMRYFLELSVANEFLVDWCQSLKREPTLKEKCQRLIQYAINDA